MNELDHLAVPLAGMNLIEASAGTGKTYAIGCLYLRLLVERGLSPEEILVVTYTEAATQELRGRIRARIREALSLFEGNGTGDRFLQDFCSAHSDETAKREAVRRLDRALNSFDLASIFTIHGFCLRVLEENGFETGSFEEMALLPDQQPLLQEIVDDFWRSRFFGPDSPHLPHALHSGWNPEMLMKFVSSVSAAPGATARPSFSEEETRAIEARCSAAFAGLGRIWQHSAGEIAEMLRSHKGLRRSQDCYREDLVEPLLEGMADYLEGNDFHRLFNGFEKFCSGFIQEKAKKNHPPPTHPFFDLCETLSCLVRQCELALRWELISFCRDQLPLRKRALKARSFDDLLCHLHAVLNGEGGEAVAALLRNRYRGALIDEFQDTDPVQYEIFRSIYGAGDLPLFLIGDPKQAIYSFRGADIFAYIRAAGDVEREKRFTLTGNWRSSPSLLSALNLSFDKNHPFLFEEIQYHPAHAGKEWHPEAGFRMTAAAAAETGRLAARGEDAQLSLDFTGECPSGSCRDASPAREDAPLQIWLAPPRQDGESARIGDLNGWIPAAVAGEIRRLIGGGPERGFIDGRPVDPADIAVLVRSHRQAAAVEKALRKAGIPSVMRSDRSIFETGEALEVHLLLSAIAEPGDERKVRAALVTSILGRTGDDIVRLLEDENEWERILERFRSYHELWRQKGFMVMARTLLAEEGVRGRLLRLAGGERRLTNVLHCFELIHERSHQSLLGPVATLSWFGEKIHRKDPAEEYQIRLETDEQAVRIVTVFVSKGLEYPIVFCPFMWGGVREEDGIVSFHEGFETVTDFGSDRFDSGRVQARKEGLAESLRLLYVALTRARYRCYLVAGKVVNGGRGAEAGPETSAVSCLFHGGDDLAAADDPVLMLAETVKALSGEEVEKRFSDLQAQSRGSIAVSRMPLPESIPAAGAGAGMTEDLSCRIFRGTVENDWTVASFTSFSRHGTTHHEYPDRDETAPGEPPPECEPPQGRSIFTFPRGAKAGIFLHDVFERLDFSEPFSPATSALVHESLARHGFEPEWQPHVLEMMKGVVSTPLSAGNHSFTLGGLERGSWIVEMEFFFPLRFISPECLGKELVGCGVDYPAVDLAAICRSLDFKPAKGMVRGFMDMVFRQGGKYYLVDWKSNHLGYRAEDYSAGAMKRAMEQNLYPLQYLLYTVALNRYLSLRVPGYDYASSFGGVIYVFLRGAGSGRGEETGFFRDTPPGDLIDRLTNLLLDVEGT